MNSSRLFRFVLMLLAPVAAVSMGSATAHADTTTLVPAGSTWKYLDDGSNQGTGWNAPFFNDSSWKSGPAQLGYGDGDEATVLNFGPNTNAKFITTYFRKSFSVPDPTVYSVATVNLMRDDGAVVYLNGMEIFRSNMPPIYPMPYNAPASSTINAPAESEFFAVAVDPALLVAGSNVLAVEAHQIHGKSSDISFELIFTADTASPARNLQTQVLQEEAALIGSAADTDVDAKVSPETMTAKLASTSDDADDKVPDAQYAYLRKLPRNKDTGTSPAEVPPSAPK